MSIQRNDREVDLLMKEILVYLGNHDTTKSVITMVSSILSWFKNKSNITSSQYYQALEAEQIGKGSGIFYKHMS